MRYLAILLTSLFVGCAEESDDTSVIAGEGIVVDRPSIEIVGFEASPTLTVRYCQYEKIDDDIYILCDDGGDLTGICPLHLSDADEQCFIGIIRYGE